MKYTKEIQAEFCRRYFRSGSDKDIIAGIIGLNKPDRILQEVAREYQCPVSFLRWAVNQPEIEGNVLNLQGLFSVWYSLRDALSEELDWLSTAEIDFDVICEEVNKRLICALQNHKWFPVLAEVIYVLRREEECLLNDGEE